MLALEELCKAADSGIPLVALLRVFWGQKKCSLCAMLETEEMPDKRHIRRHHGQYQVLRLDSCWVRSFFRRPLQQYTAAHMPLQPSSRIGDGPSEI